MSLKFGTSGLRGVASDLRGKATARYTDAFARHLIRSGLVKLGDRVLLGRDYRDSSPDIAATAVGALERAGLTRLDCGCLPTPALALFGFSLVRRRMAMVIVHWYLTKTANRCEATYSA